MAGSQCRFVPWLVVFVAFGGWFGSSRLGSAEQKDTTLLQEIAACERGDLGSCNSVGMAYERADLPELAVRYFRKVCEGGEPVGCSNLAEFYFDGRGVPQDRARAFQLFSSACKDTRRFSGCAGVCVSRFENGSLTSELSATCLKIVQASCSNGNAWMCPHAEKLGGRSAAAAPPAKTASPSTEESGCRTGGTAIAEAYLRSNPLYAAPGEFEAYVRNNRQHFAENSDAIRCAQALARFFMGEAARLYDPSERGRRDQLNAQLGLLGLSPEPQQSTASSETYYASMRLTWLARGLPGAALGDYTDLNTPANEYEELLLLALRTLRTLLQDPEMRQILQQVAPSLHELAGLERQSIQRAAAALAKSP